MITEGDHRFISELVNYAGWLQFIGDRNVYSEKDAIAYIQMIRNTPNLTYRTIALNHDRTTIGIISWMKRDYLDHFNIGFALLPQYHKKG